MTHLVRGSDKEICVVERSWVCNDLETNKKNHIASFEHTLLTSVQYKFITKNYKRFYDFIC